MAIQVSERFGSRGNNGGTIEFLYWVLGTDSDALDEPAMKAAVLAVAPADYEGVEREDITDWEQQGNGLWYATVSYPTGAGGTGGAEATQSFEFDTTQGTQHITEAINSDRLTYSEGDGAPDFGTAIGVTATEDGFDIDGVDIGVKALDFSVTRKIPTAEFDSAYLQSLYDLSWTYNDDDLAITFNNGATITFPMGTILFKGARGGAKEGERVEVTLVFSYSPNLFGFDVDDIGVESKLGWQYLWVYRTIQVRDDASSGKKWLCPKAVGVYVDDVYYPADLDALNVA